MPGHYRNLKSSNHWFRLVVPVDLRAKVGRSEIKHSLGTSNDLEADTLRAKHRQEWTARFEELRQEKAQEDLAQAPIVVDEFLRVFASRRHGNLDGAMYSLQKLLTVKLLTAWGPHEFEGRGADRAVAFMPEIDAWEGQPDPCSDIIPEDERDRLVARIRLLHHHPGTFGAGFREAIRYVSSGRRWDAVRSDVMMIEEFTGRTIDHGTAFYDAVAETYVQRLLEHFSCRWDPALLDDLDPPAGHQDAFPAPQHSQLQAEERTVPPPDTNLGRSSDGMSPLSAGFEKWIKVAAPGASAVREARRAVERFIELFGDKPIVMITEDDLFNHRDFVEDMPANLSLPAIKAGGLSLRVAVEQAWAERPDRAKLSPTSVKKEMSAFSAIFGVLKSERWIRFNPAADIPVSGYSKARTKQKSPRLPLRPNMMVDLFASPLFAGCAGRSDKQRTLPGLLVFQDELYWTFLFGADGLLGMTASAPPSTLLRTGLSAIACRRASAS